MKQFKLAQQYFYQPKDIFIRPNKDGLFKTSDEKIIEFLEGKGLVGTEVKSKDKK